MTKRLKNYGVQLVLCKRIQTKGRAPWSKEKSWYTQCILYCWLLPWSSDRVLFSMHIRWWDSYLLSTMRITTQLGTYGRGVAVGRNYQGNIWICAFSSLVARRRASKTVTGRWTWYIGEYVPFWVAFTGPRWRTWNDHVSCIMLDAGAVSGTTLLWYYRG